MSMTITKDRLKDVMRGLERMEKEPLLVGVPSKKTTREGAEDDEPITNAAIGRIMEYGSPKANIPARPWLISGIEKAEPRTNAQLKKAGQAALDGDLRAYERRVNAAGIEAVSVIKNRIRNIIPPPLAPSTLANRRNRKISPRTGTTPLIDTGRFLNSISYVVGEDEGA